MSDKAATSLIPRIEPHVVAVWIEDDWHAVMDQSRRSESWSGSNRSLPCCRLVPPAVPYPREREKLLLFSGKSIPVSVSDRSREPPAKAFRDPKSWVAKVRQSDQRFPLEILSRLSHRDSGTLAARLIPWVR